MKKIALLIFLLLGFFFTGCHENVKKSSPHLKIAENTTIKYAKGFAVFKQNGKTKVVVYNPWKKGKKILAAFVLVRNNPGKGEIKVPLKKVAVFSATQLDALEKLGLLNRVTGISEARFISNPNVKKALAKGKITEMAAGGNYFIETILKHRPDAIFYSPFQGNTQLPQTLSSILAIPYLDYTEMNPLGRAEWIKFSALFFGKEKQADSIFRNITKQYFKLKKLVDTVSVRPTVFSDKFFNGQWYIAGGRSYIARLFKDAGAHYLWENDRHTASFPLSFETVFQKARNADYWRIVGTFGHQPSYAEIAKENALYTQFKAFKQHHILYCDPQKTAYFEKSAMEPQWILADFIKAFHPELLPHYHPVFYHLIP
ncbi:ABC transporter substrate-binding protein [Candidatus Sulfidibacterium hydrothermale]|uniref:ABC transporter substrate-binding protein n=1 Tax=Candidatus Sulfidibacterium hydrothermale TaxID=2875962 RepID=UPI001F0A460B|nr:ABC transporter substrate-binding protein [Candidatus Sulfidibacterium hydrothermale]UBM61629.1 ABC transporter substrate-binding protein [Candidatus Sulfidibacterium hydrothermale]